jgi:hypothetical protein
MNTGRWLSGVAAVCAVGLAAAGGAAETNRTDAAAAGIGRITGAGKYAFVVFHRGGDGTAAVREAVKKAVEEAKGRAESVEVDVADAANAATVRTYGANRAPLPLVLAVASNGAVTGGFPGSCEPQALADAMVGPKGASCLKTLQDGKVVVICVEPAGSKTAEATAKAVAAFKADQRISDFAESIVIDPADQAEQGFLGKLRVDPKSDKATTLLVTPPGRIVGTYTNAVTTESMFADLARSMAGSTCGGGGGGCGPASGGCR